MKGMLIFCVAIAVAQPYSSFAKSATASNATGAPAKPDSYEPIYDATVKGKSPEEYFRAINGGWSKNLSTLRPRLDPARSYLVIHSQEPKDIFDLRSPKIFKRGLMSKGISKMAKSTIGIGHVFLSWRCQLASETVEGTVGMTGELDDQFKKMLEAGWGLTTFITNFTDGHLQTPALLDFEFDGADPVHSLAIEVDPSVCGNAMAFVKKFVEHPDRPFENFGLQKDPAKFEGGGCGSFGATVLDQSGIFGKAPIIPNFWRHMAARTSLFGYGDLELPPDSEPVQLRSKGKHSVSAARLFLLSNWNASRRDGGQKIKIMDPELLLLFLKTVYRSFYKDIVSADRHLAAQFRQSALFQPRIVIDNSIVAITKEEARRLEKKGHVVIDHTYDQQSITTVRQTQAWVKGLKAQGFRARAVKVGAGSKLNFGVILDKASH